MRPPVYDRSGPASAVARFAEEMGDRWRAGERPATEEFLGRRPELWDRAEAALELIAEELALREEYGRPVSDAELVGRFPMWAAQVRALRDCQRVFGRPGAVSFPTTGATLGEFRLIEELGRGAHGRVFRAAQTSLGGRPVVLKLAPDAGAEHLSLARLQHTHVVPLYAAYDFPDRGLRALCMPYFGGETLHALLARDGLPAGSARAEPVCGMGACLAEALEYAHDRGLLHLDLKPSNVLIAADGTPMLLDFHLARPPLAGGDPAPAGLGGTPGYMAPELAAAMRAAAEGDPAPRDIDARSDVYSLGVLLHECLAGAPVPTGLGDVLDRCTAADPTARYPTAAALAADLRRHLAHEPLRGVANRDPVERYRKWRRRWPLALPLALVLSAAVVAAGSFAERTADRRDRAGEALRDGEAHLHRGRYAEAVEAFRGGEVVLAGAPFDRPLVRRLRDGRRLAERGQAAIELHALGDRVRPLYAAAATPGQVRAADLACAAVWAERDAVVERLTGQPAADLEPRWRADLLDIGILHAHLGARAGDGSAAAHREALAVLDEAERLLGPSRVLHLERAAHARAMGDAALERESERQADATESRTSWEYLVTARARLATGDWRGALAGLDRCLDRDAGSLWGNYYRGVCLLQLEASGEAAEAFSVCVALAPDSAWCLYNRGLALDAVGRTGKARANFARALALDPSLPPPR